MIKLSTSLQLCLLVLLSYENIFYTSSFTIQNTVNSRRSTSASTSKHMVSNSIGSMDNSKVVDHKGTEFTPSCTIQTVSEIKAYQVARKGYGSYDEETKSFNPVDIENIESVARVDRCLVLPKGSRATVTKVYNLDEYDATSPVVAKFLNKDGLGGDYVVPVTFLMHFETHEIEVVE